MAKKDPSDKPKPPKKSKPKVVDIQTKKIPPPPKPKVPTVLGSKARAGRLLSHHLRVIAQEATELGPEENMVTKAEALARTMFKLALGSKVIDKNGVEIIAVPDRGMIALIWDRIEGRAAQTDVADDKKMTVPKKVSAENKKRLNSLALGDNDIDAKLETEPVDTLPNG